MAMMRIIVKEDSATHVQAVLRTLIDIAKDADLDAVDIAELERDTARAISIMGGQALWDKSHADMLDSHMAEIHERIKERESRTGKPTRWI
jgi:hypothetical protein